MTVKVKRTRLHRLALKAWTVTRHIPIARWVTKKLIYRGVLIQVGNMPWKRLKR